MADGVPLALTKRKRFRAHYGAMAARDPNFRLQFLAADQGDPVLEDRLLAASDADDAAREAAFWGWPTGARVCRIADLDGQEVASVARFRLAESRTRSTERRNRAARQGRVGTELRTHADPCIVRLKRG
jgi:hypothetical protein